ncbi:DEKNAAC102065 [Brettanomyces naardenensis]|uniref:AP-2 complex subunit alpha n=1 Tax=Brettanomyces naardenensis TaxID=13370 RepID=A0A448YJM5_BRENA|nr:DEKNAAC102065 [Brettanomyces naardenensis]
MAPQMKGLVQFITEIRNAKEEPEEERRIQAELVHIQKQFQQPGLSGYHRKKYLCKLLYINMMGHSLTFGFDEAIQLTLSQSYSEKEVGYLAINVFIQQRQADDDDDDERLAQWHKVYTSIDSDLDSSNADFVGLALHAVADLCDYNEEIVPRYEVAVFRALRAPDLSSFVKKKAALTLCKLIKVDSGTLARHPEIASRAALLVNSDDPGMVLAVCPLIDTIARLEYKACEPCITLSIDRLYRLVVQHDCPEDYYFHGTPAPWTAVKLFHLLGTLVPDSSCATQIDAPDRDKLTSILQSAISASIDASSNPACSADARKACGSILFGALALSAHISSDEGQAAVAADALCALLKSPDINGRYLALGALLQIAARNDTASTDAIGTHFDTICLLLRDRDVSIRRRALDLIYMICGPKTIEKTCSELLKYLAISEFSMKSDVAVKVAVLAETFAADAVWFVLTITKLMALAGNYVEDDVWCRMAQIVVNNDQIQPTACRTIVRYLKAGQYPESMLKLGAFLLSEFGESIQDTSSLPEQFSLLYSRYPQTSVLTRSMLLTSFFKFYGKCPQLHTQITNVFQQECDSFSVEIQQRALEYLSLVKMDSPQVFKIMIADMPPFTSKVSPLLARLGTVQTLKQSFKLPQPQEPKEQPRVQDHQDEPDNRGKPLLSTSEAVLSTTAISMAPNNSSSSSIARPSPPPPPPSRRRRELTISSLSDAGSLSGMSTGSNNSRRSSMSLLQSHDPILSPNWKEGYYRLCKFDQGIFFESSLIRIVYRLKRDHSTLHITLNYTNKSPSAISGLTSKIIHPVRLQQSDAPPYTVTIIKHPDSTVAENGRTTELVDLTVRSMYRDSEVPIININFISGGLTNIKLKLPVILLKALNPGARLSEETFFARWNQIAHGLGSEGEAQLMIKLTRPTSTSALGRLITLVGFDNLKGVDPNPHNLIGAGILDMAQGNSGCLMRIELNPKDSMMVRLTIRCTSPGLADLLAESLSSLMMNTY